MLDWIVYHTLMFDQFWMFFADNTSVNKFAFQSWAPKKPNISNSAKEFVTCQKNFNLDQALLDQAKN